jgi:tRNA pseudouridine38-40 synthase
VGDHDFESFRAASCGRDHARRTLHRIDITRSRSGRQVCFDVEGTAFLKHMVRILVGSLLQVGTHKHPPGWIAEARDARDRRAGGPTAPPHGLCLMRVLYDELPGPAEDELTDPAGELAGEGGDEQP